MISGILLTLALALGAMVVLGAISKQTGAGVGLAELGAGLQQAISLPLSPQIKPSIVPTIGLEFTPGIWQWWEGARSWWATIFPGLTPGGTPPEEGPQGPPMPNGSIGNGRDEDRYNGGTGLQWYSGPGTGNGWYSPEWFAKWGSRPEDRAM